MDRIFKQFWPSMTLTKSQSNCFRGFLSAPNPMDSPKNGHLRQPGVPAETRQNASWFLENLQTQVHNLNGNHMGYPVNPNILPNGPHFGYRFSMVEPEPIDPWIQRPRFRALVDEWVAIHPGQTKDDLAKEMGMPNWKVLKQYYSGRVKIPGRSRIQKMAQVLKCQASDLMDDPGAQVVGQSTEGMSEKSRFLAALMFDKFKADDLTDEDREILYQDWLQNYDRLRMLKARHEKRN